MCNEYLGMFLDSSNAEWWPTALGTLGVIASGLVLAAVKRRWNLEDQRQIDEQKAISGEFTKLHLKFEAECESRRSKDDNLGYDIQDTRGALDWLCGTLGKGRPPYRR